MLFKLTPKENRDELFDREEELRELHRLTRTEWVIVLGKRMTGKTSLLKTFLNEVNGIYVNATGMRSIRELIAELMKHVRDLRISIDLGLAKVTWTKIVDDVFSKLEGRIIGLDEVQELPSNYFLKILKRVWDTYDIRFVFTGSMVGVIKNLIEPGPLNPMYGRQPAILRLNPFTRELSREFLLQGFSECGLRISDSEIDEVVELFNGYVGWLAYYGNYRCIRRVPHSKALELVYSEGKKIMMNELERFLSNKKNRDKYIRLLKMLPARWRDLELGLNVNKKVLRDMLRNLEYAFIVEKRGATYVTSDPVLRRLVMEL